MDGAGALVAVLVGGGGDDSKASTARFKLPCTRSNAATLRASSSKPMSYKDRSWVRYRSAAGAAVTGVLTLRMLLGVGNAQGFVAVALLLLAPWEPCSREEKSSPVLVLLRLGFVAGVTGGIIMLPGFIPPMFCCSCIIVRSICGFIICRIKSLPASGLLANILLNIGFCCSSMVRNMSGFCSKAFCIICVTVGLSSRFIMRLAWSGLGGCCSEEGNPGMPVPAQGFPVVAVPWAVVPVLLLALEAALRLPPMAARNGFVAALLALLLLLLLEWAVALDAAGLARVLLLPHGFGMAVPDAPACVWAGSAVRADSV